MNRHIFTLQFLIWISCSAVPSKAAIIFECDFEEDTCGLVNDACHQAKWERKEMTLGGQKSYVMAVEAEGGGREIAKLLFPILNEHRSGLTCLSLNLFIKGDHDTSFRMKHQDGSGGLRLLADYTQRENWTRYHLLLDIEDYVRFIFEAYVNRQWAGNLVAIDNISFKTEECS